MDTRTDVLLYFFLTLVAAGKKKDDETVFPPAARGFMLSRRPNSHGFMLSCALRSKNPPDHVRQRNGSA